MGAGTSHHTEYEAALDVFNSKERDNIKEMFESASSGGRTITEVGFQSYLADHMPSVLINRLYEGCCHILTADRASGNPAVGIDIESFTVMLASVMKGTAEQRSHILMTLSKRNPRSANITGEELNEAVSYLLAAYMKMMSSTKQYKSWQIQHKAESDERMVAFLLKDIVKFDNLLHSLYSEDVERWLMKSAFVTHMIDYIFYTCFPVSYVDDVLELQQCVPKVPFCVDVDWTSCRSLLELSTLVFLNHSVPPELSTQWRLLFNSRTHGESFSTMLKHIVNRGPSVVLVEDKQGHVFGGFASESWSYKPSFYGSASCFLFTLLPQVGRYYPTGVNQNYIYLNHGQQTLPNGLGFGGQFEYFGLWLDAEYGCGHSKAQPTCSTYTSPRLSANEKFEFEYLEIWGVGPEPSAAVDASKRSILDEDPGAKAMLSLIGKGPVSEGLRETDPTAESPEEHNLPPM